MRSVRAFVAIVVLALLSPQVARPVAAGGIVVPNPGVQDRVLEEVSVSSENGEGLGASTAATPSVASSGMKMVRKALRPKLVDIKLDDSKVNGGAVGSTGSRPESGIKDLPPDAVAVDVRLDYEVPDTNIPGTTVMPDTLIACKSFLVHHDSVDPYDGKIQRFRDLGSNADIDRRGGEDVVASNVNIIAIEPLPGMPDVHHMHLHVCDDDSSSWKRHRRSFEDTFDPTNDERGVTPAKGKKPLYCAPPSWDPGSGCHGTAWTFLPGQHGVLFPEGVGMKIGDGPLDLRRLILEVHYDKANNYPHRRDQSGIRLWTTPRDDAIVHRAGVFSVADPFARLPQSLPPGEKEVTYDTFCPPGCTKRFETPMHVFASMTHAHLRARHVLTSVGTPDANGAVPVDGWRSVVNDDGSGTATGHFSHEDQKFVPVDFTLNAGDSLKTTCIYDTEPMEEPIPFGPATTQEMCMQVFLYWPKQYTFLCGYYGDQAYWCGDAEMFVPKDGSDRTHHGERCYVGGGVGGAGQSCDDRNKELGFEPKDAPDKDEKIKFLTR